MTGARPEAATYPIPPTSTTRAGAHAGRSPAPKDLFKAPALASRRTAPVISRPYRDASTERRRAHDDFRRAQRRLREASSPTTRTCASRRPPAATSSWASGRRSGSASPARTRMPTPRRSSGGFRGAGDGDVLRKVRRPERPARSSRYRTQAAANAACNRPSTKASRSLSLGRNIPSQHRAEHRLACLNHPSRAAECPFARLAAWCGLPIS